MSLTPDDTKKGASLLERIVPAFRITERCACSHPAGDHSWVVDHKPDGRVKSIRLAHCQNRDCKCAVFEAKGA